MIPEALISVLFVMVMMEMLFPELFKPAPATGVISGGLTTRDGARVDAATVTLYSADKLTEIAVVASDANGMYTLPEEAMGPYHITAIKKNADGSWLQADMDITINAIAMSADLTMDRTASPNRISKYYPLRVTIARPAMATSIF